MKLSCKIFTFCALVLIGDYASASVHIEPSVTDTVNIVVNYRLNESNIDSLYSDNASALDAIRALIGDSPSQIQTITVFGSASPEGQLSANRILAGKRAESLKEKVIGYGAKPSLINLGENVYEYPSASRLEYPRLRYASAVISLVNTSDTIVLPNQAIIEPEVSENIDSVVPISEYTEETIYEHEYDETVITTEPHIIPLYFRANLLRWVTLTPDIGIEWRVNPQWAVLVTGSYTSWSWDNKQRRYALWEVMPEVRYYLGEKRNWYVGAMYKVGSFNYKFSEVGKQGDIMGGGITGGYILTLNNRFSIDFGLGLGYIHAKYEHYKVIDNVRVRQDKDNSNWFGPVSAGITLVWKPF